MTEPIIEARDAHCVFKVREGLFGRTRLLQAVRGVDVTVAPGETLAIVGESGCGKTTLGRMMLGLQQQTSGSIMLDGKPVDAWSRADRATRVQAVFQDPFSSLNPSKTIGAIIALPLQVQGPGKRLNIRREVAQIVDKVGLPQRVLAFYPNQLSGGQRQRVAIARALVSRPRLLICDEPTSALDVSVQSQILNLLTEIRTEFGLALVLITHNLAIVEQLADRVAVMYLGRIVEIRGTRSLLDRPGHHYTDGLLRSVLPLEPGKGIPDPHLREISADPFAPPSGCALHPRCPSADELCRTTVPPATARGDGRLECHHPIAP